MAKRDSKLFLYDILASIDAIVKDDLPELKKQIKKIYDELGGQEKLIK